MLACLRINKFLAAQEIVEIESIVFPALPQLENMWTDVSVNKFLEVVNLNHLQKLHAEHSNRLETKTSVTHLKQIFYSVAEVFHYETVALVGFRSAPVHPRNAG